MSVNPKRNKSALRTAARARRNTITAEQRASFSTAICSRLQQHLRHIAGTECLLAYRATADEVDTAAIFADPPCRLFAPRTHDHGILDWLEVSAATTWKPGAFGIMEPQEGSCWSPEAGSTILVCPMTGFDRQGNRLGMGKGCFDRWLAQHRPHLSLTIGLAFACQEIPAIPAEMHDMPLDVIITEQEVIACPIH